MSTNAIKIGFTTLKRWLENRNAGKTFSRYIAEHGWETVAIYGAGEVGRILYEEIKWETNVLYFIDRNAETYCEIDGVPVVLPQNIGEMAQCDIVINTVMSGFDTISAAILAQNPRQAIIALRDAVYEF